MEPARAWTGEQQRVNLTANALSFDVPARSWECVVGHSERAPIHVGLPEVGITTVMQDEKSAGRMGCAFRVSED